MSTRESSFDPAAPWAAALRAAARGCVVVLGIGNDLRGDDGAGSLVARELGGRFPGLVFDGGQAPENLSGPLRRARPDAVIVVDAADFGAAPGEVRVVSAAEGAGGLTLGTHALPIGTFLAALAETTGAAIHLVAVQAATTEFGAAMTPAVAAAVGDVARELAAVLADARQGGDQ
ncbi:MAG: hydrogenase maturation protease [Candidatus Eisenbacteria bacterium]|nr:hydrogenase maturation protease [Candidatus Eisenbacteria bacterium]